MYLVAEEPEYKQFVVATDGLQNIESTGQDVDEVAKGYARQEARPRLHQPVFRGRVLQAYKTRCAIRTLRHSVLLDAAHIFPDSDSDGVAAVRNGLALCKIHHAAYDEGIIGVSPDYVIGARDDILEEIYGPMLEFGLKGLHGHRLSVAPSSRKERPDRELLERQFQLFAAGKASRSRPLRSDFVV